MLSAMQLKQILFLLLIFTTHVKASMVFTLKYTEEKLKLYMDSSTNISDLDSKWNLRGRPGQGYYTSVLIGKPPQQLNVLVDTGSSNFAIAAAQNPSVTKYFHRSSSSTFKDSGIHINVPYTQGHWKGNLGHDIVSLPNVVNTSVVANVACIMESDDFFIADSDWQGILGLAYSNIARPDSSVTPYFDELVDSGKSANVFSLQLCGPSGRYDNNTGGVLVVGDIDDSLYYGPLTYTPVTREWYYEVLLTSIGVANNTLDIDCVDLNTDKTIIDSGTTNFRLPSKILDQVIDAIKSTVMLSRNIPNDFWRGSKMMCWHRLDVIPWNDFPFLKLSLAHENQSSFSLKIGPQQYLRKVVDKDNETTTHECFKFAIDESKTGTIIGAVIMEGFYVVFDRQRKRIGFAQSACARHYLPNPPSIGEPFHFSDPVGRCKYIKPTSNTNDKLLIVAYVMAGICGISVIPMLVMLMQWIWTNLIKARFKCSDSSSDFAFLVQ